MPEITEGASGGYVQPESVDVALGSSYTFTIVVNPGWAIDTITLDSVSYINNGVNDPPPSSTWTSILVQNIDNNTSLSISFAISISNDDVPDKYKNLVTASAGDGGSVHPDRQYVYDGESAVINITSDKDMAVDTISVESQSGSIEQYINNGLD